MEKEPTRILFVCLGNICRSPLAEALFRHQLRQRGLEHRFEVDSAGTSAYHAGSAPDARSTEVARQRGISITGTSRSLSAADWDGFDYVIAMDAENLREIERLRTAMGGRARVHRLREWDPAPDSGDVPDPYYGGARGFEEVHDIVERSCAALLDDLLRREVRA